MNTNEKKAMETLAFYQSQTKSQLDYILCPCPIDEYKDYFYRQYFTLGCVGIEYKNKLIGISLSRFLEKDDFLIWQISHGALEPFFRKKGLFTLLMGATVGIVAIIERAKDKSCLPMSMPDGEPECLRSFLKAIGAEEQEGFNSDGLPMLFKPNKNNGYIDNSAKLDYRKPESFATDKSEKPLGYIDAEKIMKASIELTAMYKKYLR